MRSLCETMFPSAAASPMSLGILLLINKPRSWHCRRAEGGSNSPFNPPGFVEIPRRKTMERSTPAWETNGLGCVWGIAYSHREYFGDGFRRASGNLHETILLRNEGQAEAGHR
ncbi:hypothetical protein PM082_024429 [Marasmius tenuissimus]|nr:hypothetical protein PM082_024429 [Marasmius tenuissimus]